MKHESDDDRRRLRDVEQLKSLLAEIPLGVDLSLSLGAGKADACMDHRAVKSEVERWLTTREPQVGAEMCTSGIDFQIVQVGCRSPVRVVWVNLGAIYVNPVLLRRIIRKKISKYAHLEVPLIVAAGARLLTGFDLEDFEEALVGRLDQKGLFATQKSLSAGLWIPRRSNGASQIRVFRNPGARLPLPKAAIGADSAGSP